MPFPLPGTPVEVRTGRLGAVFDPGPVGSADACLVLETTRGRFILQGADGTWVPATSRGARGQLLERGTGLVRGTPAEPALGPVVIPYGATVRISGQALVPPATGDPDLCEATDGIFSVITAEAVD